MRSSMLVARILCTLFVFVSLSAAWPWPPYAEQKDGVSTGHGVVMRRQDEGSNDEETTTEDKTEPASTADSETASETGNTEDATITGTQTSDPEETGTKTDDESQSTITDIDPRLPAGGIKMIEPPAISTTYYKIADKVTFKWNYTSLSVTPSGINVVASCALNNHAYTITANDTISGPTGEVVWDTGAYQANATVPLLTETYTLLVYDVDKDPTDIASAGHLGASINFRFGMYLPQSYTPLDSFQCATCNAALSPMERQALGFGLAMISITVLSFAWFVNGLNLS
ncbi:hypothetical protein FQN54_002897 [Arachnomyces sp. PD_36]|nr:hypothetical protein FQN54_002897 [Arachnomyces sp. PD_36]